MTPVQAGLLAAVLTVLLLAAACYGFYAYVFVRVRKTMNRMYALQEQYKELASVSFGAATRPLELLMRRRQRYDYVAQYMKWFDRRYREQLELAGKTVEGLRDLKGHFALKGTARTLDALEERLKTLRGWVGEYGALTEDAFTYQNASASLMVSYRRLVDGVDAFLWSHLLPKYDSPVFKTSVAQISRGFEEADGASARFENDLLLRYLQHLRDAVRTLLGYAWKLYSGDRRLEYLSFLAAQADALRGQGENDPVRDGARLNVTYRALAEAKDNIAKARRMLHLFQFRDAAALADDVARTLEPLTQRLESEARARDIVRDALSSFGAWVKAFAAKHAALEKTIARMDAAFGPDEKVAAAAAAARAGLDAVRGALSRLDAARRGEGRSYGSILRLMTEIVDSTEGLKGSLRELLSGVHARLAEYRASMFKANDLKLKFAQLRSFAHKHALSLGHPNDALLDEWVAAVSGREAGLREDYAGSQGTFAAFAKAADDALVGLLESVVEAAQMRALAEASLMFLNKFRNESADIERSASKIEQMIDGGRHEAALRAAITVLRHIGDNAREFGLRL